MTEPRLADGTRCIDVPERYLYRRLEAIEAGSGPTADKPLLLIELARRGLPRDRPLYTRPHG